MSIIRSRLKYGFIPTRRLVDEDENCHFIFPEAPVETHSHIDEKGSLEKVLSTEVSDQQQTFEYRDEKDRKWYKFFDEYEYRVTNKVKSNRKWYHWFHDDDTAAERRVIVKIDILLTLYSLMAYWVKYLDQTNLTNAYVGGLEQAIDMKGNDFIKTQVMFTVGNIIFQIPFMYILYAFPLNYVLPSLDLGWSILTISLYRVKNVPSLKALRFFIGGFEATSYIAYHSLFASWFKGGTGEVSRRAGFYYLGQYLGILTSGLLSGAIERHMGGINGLEAWQWIFIIDGIISVVVGVLGFYMLPGTPEDCYSIFLSDDDIRIARKRMLDDQKGFKPRENVVKYFFDIKLLKSIFTSWHVYVLCLWNIFCWNNSNMSTGAFALWLKSLTNADGKPRFGPGELQDYTALPPGLGLLWLTITCSIADLFNTRTGAIIFSQVFNVLGNVLLAVWDLPEGAKWFGFCVSSFGWAMAPVLYSWLGDISRKDIRERNIMLVICNIIAQQSTAWTSVLVFPTVEAPRFLKGYSFTAASGVALSLWTFVVLYFYKKDERANAKDNGIIIFNSATDPDFAASELDDGVEESKKVD
ncbi:putative permease [Scheffersomyces coipomensis]|uniref:putative permease n=1 Tax=Scheffersomyces coipomensis TaxID=1788519 RepID=UPI00315D47C2